MYALECINNCIYCTAVLISIYTDEFKTVVRDLLMHPLMNCHQTSQEAGTSTVECPRVPDVCYSRGAHSKIYKTVNRFKETIYESMTESIHRQWRLALVKEGEKTFISPDIVHFIHVTQQVNCTAKWHKMN